LKKDQSLFADVVTFLLNKIWPKIGSSKQALFLNEVEDIIGAVGETVFSEANACNAGSLFYLIFRRIGECIECPHFKVAERSLTFFGMLFFIVFISM
jgi:hypothetical protein